MVLNLLICEIFNSWQSQYEWAPGEFLAFSFNSEIFPISRLSIPCTFVWLYHRSQQSSHLFSIILKMWSCFLSACGFFDPPLQGDTIQFISLQLSSSSRQPHQFYTLSVIRESVDSLCRDGADAQYMQYLSKSRITSPQIHFKRLVFIIEYLCDQQDSYKCPKATRKTAKRKSVW